jgi:hypothetical protein
MGKGIWLFLLTFAEPYTGLLVALLAVTVVRAGLWSRRLFGGMFRHRTRVGCVLDGSVSPDGLARAALGNLVSNDAPSPERVARLRAGSRVELDAALRTLRAADARFDYLWRRLAIGVSSTRGLWHLALIAAAIITAYGCFPHFEYFVVDGARGASSARLTALYEGGKWVMARLALGLGVAAVLAVLAMVFDGVLQHRLASWKYLYAKTRDALSGRQPLE